MKAQAKEDRINILGIEAIVSALHTVAAAVVNPEEVKFDDTNKILKTIRELLFPAAAEAREAQAKRAAAIIDKESQRKLSMVLPQTNNQGFVPRNR